MVQCCDEPPQVTMSAAVTEREQLKAICIAFKNYFESTYPDLFMHILTFNSMFKKTTNEALSVVAQRVHFESTKVYIANDPLKRQPIHDAFIQWLKTSDAAQFKIITIEDRVMMQVADAEQQQPSVAPDAKSSSSSAEEAISKIRSDAGGLFGEIKEAAKNAIDSAVSKAGEAAASTTRDACETLKRDCHVDVQRALAIQKAMHDAEKAETTKRVDSLEKELSSLRVTQQQERGIDKEQRQDTGIMQLITSLEKKVQDLSVQSSQQRQEEKKSEEQATAEPLRNLKRGRDDEGEMDNTNSSSGEIPQQERRRTVQGRRTATAKTHQPVVGDITLLPYRAIRQCIAAVFGGDTVRGWEEDLSKSNASKKK